MRIAPYHSVMRGDAAKEESFRGSSRFVVLFAVTLLLLGIGFRIYRFTLPTEGWSFRTDFFQQGLVFDQNLLGVPSPFQEGDLLLDVAGTNIFQIFAFQKEPAEPEVYHLGNAVSYTVQRGERTLRFETELHPWTARGVGNAFAQIFLNRVPHLSPFLLLQLALAIFVFIKRPNNGAAQILLLMFATNLASGMNWIVGGFSPADMFDPLAREATDWLAASINVILFIPLLVHLALVFPKPKWGFDKVGWPAILLYGLPLTLTLLWQARLIPATADYVVPFYFVVMLVAYFHSLLTFKEPVLRAQMKWLAYGGVVWAVVALAEFSTNLWPWPPPFMSERIDWLSVEFLWVLCLAIAILKYRLFDIDLIINRTLVYGTLSLGVLGVYLGLVTGSSYLLQTQSNMAVYVLAGAIIAFLLKPFYQVLQQGVNRFIPVTTTSLIIATPAPVGAANHVQPETVPLKAGAKEKKFDCSSFYVILFAIVLLILSLGVKAYRLTLPTDGWSTTTDLETDAPIFVNNLLDTPSELKPGDRLIAVNGVVFEDLMWRAIRGEKSLEAYQAGETVTYTILRGGKQLDLAAPLYAGSSLGLGTILWQFLTSDGWGDLLSLLPLLLGIFVFWKRPRHLTAQLLFLQIAAMPIASGISWTVSPLGVADTLNPAAFYTAAFFTHWIHLLFEQPLGLHIILSFPRPSGILQYRWALPLLYGFPLFMLLLNLTVLPAFSPFMVVAFYNLLGILAAIRLFFGRRNAIETVQVRWFVLGFAFANIGTVVFGLSVLGFIPEAVLSRLEPFPFQHIYLLCIAIAILRYRLFDINVILNRTLVYGGLTAGVVGLYALVVGGFGYLFQSQGNVGVSLFATGLIAVAFNPLRVRLHRTANRLLYGERDEPYAVLSKLSQSIEGTLEPSKILPSITETVAQVLKLPYAGVVLTGDETSELVASYGRPKSESISLPLTHQGEQIGELQLEPRAGERFKPAELNLLKAVAQQASVAAYALKQTLDLQRSREALVTAREEERLRIRRDLHDGLGPELAGITLKLDAARNLLARNPKDADKLLLELKTQTQDAIAGIRRLVYDLRPPALDQLGLEGAVREQLRACEGTLSTTLRIEGGLANLPAAVEVACYRIVQEALTNVLRHARATTCSVSIRVSDGLELCVEDDGVGLPESVQVGVGLRSMRERAEELGGSFAVEPLQTGGARVTASLPLGAT